MPKPRKDKQAKKERKRREALQLIGLPSTPAMQRVLCNGDLVSLIIQALCLNDPREYNCLKPVSKVL